MEEIALLKATQRSAFRSTIAHFLSCHAGFPVETYQHHLLALHDYALLHEEMARRRTDYLDLLMRHAHRRVGL
jgi:hypothetical protein